MLLFAALRGSRDRRRTRHQRHPRSWWRIDGWKWAVKASPAVTGSSVSRRRRIRQPPAEIIEEFMTHPRLG